MSRAAQRCFRKLFEGLLKAIVEKHLDLIPLGHVVALQMILDLVVFT